MSRKHIPLSSGAASHSAHHLLELVLDHNLTIRYAWLCASYSSALITNSCPSDRSFPSFHAFPSFLFSLCNADTFELFFFSWQGKDVIFLETAMGLSDLRSHAVVECIPVPAGVAAKAPLYFKKGIDDAESEWSQHHAKRMIDTRAKVT